MSKKGTAFFEPSPFEIHDNLETPPKSAESNYSPRTTLYPATQTWRRRQFVVPIMPAPTRPLVSYPVRDRSIIHTLVMRLHLSRIGSTDQTFSLTLSLPPPTDCMTAGNTSLRNVPPPSLCMHVSCSGGGGAESLALKQMYTR